MCRSVCRWLVCKVRKGTLPSPCGLQSTGASSSLLCAPLAPAPVFLAPAPVRSPPIGAVRVIRTRAAVCPWQAAPRGMACAPGAAPALAPRHPCGLSHEAGGVDPGAPCERGPAHTVVPDVTWWARDPCTRVGLRVPIATRLPHGCRRVTLVCWRLGLTLGGLRVVG